MKIRITVTATKTIPDDHPEWINYLRIDNEGAIEALRFAIDAKVSVEVIDDAVPSMPLLEMLPNIVNRLASTSGITTNAAFASLAKDAFQLYPSHVEIRALIDRFGAGVVQAAIRTLSTARSTGRAAKQ